MSQSYTHLISCEQLNDLLSPDHQCDQHVVILDASIPPVGNMAAPSHSWPTTTIPNSQRFDLNLHFSDLTSPFPHMMPSLAQFQQQARALGINKNTQIIVYDDLGLFSAARAWWMFKAMGHQKIAVLDGGLPHWIELAKQIANADNIKPANEGDFEAVFNPHYFCDHLQVTQYLNSDQYKVLDARTNQRFLGKMSEPRAGVRSGHMPNALNLPYTDLLEQGRFKPINELQKIFATLVNKDHQLVMTCGSGVTACILALAAELCHYRSIFVYDGSWCEWGSCLSLPVITE